jgi:hypothetical protein
VRRQRTPQSADYANRLPAAKRDAAMPALNAAIRDIPRPAGVDQLPVDERGWTVPWFVEVFDGKPDHRVVDGRKFARAVREQRCWVCGGKLGRMKASVIGPMCAVNRITSEPPCHPPCARYAVQACPFLSKPRARRNEKDLPEERRGAAGIPIERNPGVLTIWESLHPSKPFSPKHGQSGTLFDLGAPYRVTWWREGRPATRDEVMTSLHEGLPALMKVAAQDGIEAVDELAQATLKALLLLPEAVAA